MKDLPGGEQKMFEAFLKSTQYLLCLQSQQDIWEHLGKFVLTHFPAAWLAFIERDSDNNLAFRYCTLPESVAAQQILTDEVRTILTDVLDSGFLASRVLLTPAPSMTAFLPIVENGRSSRVMLIGHTDAQPLATELLGIYLALAGLAGTTTERKRAEEEVRRLNAELERRVEQRTMQLQGANEKLLKEITERKQAEEALRASEERWETTLRSIGDAVIATDADGRVTFINEVAEKLTGWPLSEAQGKELNEIFHIVSEVSRIKPENPFAKVIRTGQVLGLANHTALISRSGREFPIEDSGAPIRGKDGKIRGVVIVFHDISGKRTAEKAVRDSERLATTGRLASSLAHEIHNPLDTIGNLLYLINHDPDMPETGRRHVAMASEELARVTQMTQHMLVFQREAKTPVPIKIDEVLHNVTALYERKIESAAIHVEKQVEFEGEFIGLPGEMRQVFANLIGNAVEAIGQNGTIRLHAYASREWRLGRCGLRVTVADNGPGIPSEIRDNIFDPFFTTKGESGTGLGLWITSGIVENNNGILRLRTVTRAGRSGTCFSVFFPFPS
jgi:PAS domain S-box-containing protein